nr:hypothetical protein JVH1_5053 [Rhodococcus sp. JVH1]
MVALLVDIPVPTAPEPVRVDVLRRCRFEINGCAVGFAASPRA